MAASKLTEDHVRAHRISEKNVIEKNLKECLQMCKVNAETEMISPWLCSFVHNSFF